MLCRPLLTYARTVVQYSDAIAPVTGRRPHLAFIVIGDGVTSTYGSLAVTTCWTKTDWLPLLGEPAVRVVLAVQSVTAGNYEIIHKIHYILGTYICRLSLHKQTETYDCHELPPTDMPRIFPFTMRNTLIPKLRRFNCYYF